MARTARLLGFAPHQLRVLPADDRLRMRPDVLAEAIDADVAAGLQPLFVSATAGATNTGAIDPLPELASVCHRKGVWLHVDGAYGGFAALSERGRHALRGIERADSVTLDPHKWLYQPFECGSLLVRDARHLEGAFAIAPDYLTDAAVHDDEVNFCDRGLQLTRACRALKVWLSVQYFGLDAFRSAVDRCLDLALRAEDRVRARPELELISPAQLGVVCFRRRGDDEEHAARRNADLVARFEATGDGLVSSTRLHGRYAIRLCVMNHTSGERVAELKAGSFFGELAALDWGAGYGYPRLATVTAATPMELLVLSPCHLEQLMAEAPGLAERIRGAKRARLATV
jgi:glutamate/tyrosine decarboxylase-like PLP-dependent enzyme